MNDLDYKTCWTLFQEGSRVTPYIRHRDALWTIARFADLPVWRVYRTLFPNAR